MAMNREQKRMMQRAGQVGADGAPITTRERRAPAKVARDERASLPQFVREVRGELKKVSWPTRAETIRFSIIVLIAIVILGAFIFAIDLGFGEAFTRLFNTKDTAAAAVLPFL